VITLSGRIAACVATFTCRWVYLWPLIAVHLEAGDLADDPRYP
jgi:hypothetical protein